MPDKPFLQLDDDVTIDLGDGIKRPLRYRISTLRRLQTAIGRPTMGRKSVLVDLDESNIPEILFHGLCDPETGDPPMLYPGDQNSRPLMMKDILDLPSSSMAYLVNTMMNAYSQFLPPPKEEKKTAPSETTQQ